MNSFLHLSAGFRTVPGNAVFALFRSPSAFCFCFYVNSLVNQLSVVRVSQYKKAQRRIVQIQRLRWGVAGCRGVFLIQFVREEI